MIDDVNLSYTNDQDRDSNEKIFLQIFPQFISNFNTRNKITVLFDQIIAQTHLTIDLYDEFIPPTPGLFEAHINEHLHIPLDISLQGMTNLHGIYFGLMFNQPLGTSLQGLTNLQTIDFGGGFNQPLGTSLQGLPNLRSVTKNGYPYP